MISLSTTNPSYVIDFVHLICQLSPRSDDALIPSEQRASVIMTQERSCTSDSCKHLSRLTRIGGASLQVMSTRNTGCMKSTWMQLEAICSEERSKMEAQS